MNSTKDDKSLKYLEKIEICNFMTTDHTPTVGELRVFEQILNSMRVTLVTTALLIIIVFFCCCSAVTHFSHACTLLINHEPWLLFQPSISAAEITTLLSLIIVNSTSWPNFKFSSWLLSS